MDEQERRQKYLAQTEALYAAIGRFAVTFEHMCFAMKSVLTQVLEIEGLRNQLLSSALLEGLTAEPLRGILSAVLGEIRQDRSDRKIVSNILTRVQKLTKERNEVIHRTWFVGWANSLDEDFSEVSGAKLHKDKQGASIQVLKYGVIEFDELSEKADELTALINRLGGCILLSRSFAINFSIDADGTVRLPAGS